jgi:hypothetical protein
MRHVQSLIAEIRKIKLIHCQSEPSHGRAAILAANVNASSQLVAIRRTAMKPPPPSMFRIRQPTGGGNNVYCRHCRDLRTRGVKQSCAELLALGAPPQQQP